MEREAHKLCTSSCDDRATNIRKQLWLWARIWITKVEDGYTCEFQEGKIGKSGICILMNPKWDNFIAKYKIVRGNMVQMPKM